MPAHAAARVHAFWPELAGLSSELLANWPDRARGVQRIHLPDNVTLTLFVDDIAAALPQARTRIDAWFLDGFAPSKNPDMWSPEAMSAVARLSRPGARAATYTVAGEVRRNLEAAGFAVEKKPGHGRKNERLEAKLQGDVPRPSEEAHPKTIVVIGAGIAGACAAHSFLKRGHQVTVIDRAPAPGAGASGNPVALVMPRLDVGDTLEARALIEAWLFARRFYAALDPEAAQRLESLHRPRGEKEEHRFARLLADPPLDETILQAVDPENASAGLRHRGAIAVQPSQALPRLLAGATLRFNTTVRSLDEIEADLVLVCAGMGAADVEGLEAPPLTGRLGQLECAHSSGPPNAIADGGYAVEAFGRLVFGATFEAAEGPPRTSDAAQAKNLETLARLRPDIASALDSRALTSRASIRATTQDRFPFAGAPAHEKAPDADPAPFRSIRLIGGLGARGFLWAPLLAELVASEALGDSLPVEADVAKALDPGRFLRRARKRGGG